jgi:hypothetical protein
LIDAGEAITRPDASTVAGRPWSPRRQALVGASGYVRMTTLAELTKLPKRR